MNHQILLREVVPEIVEEPVQQVTVNGRVTNADSRESLMGVTVFVMGTQTGNTTDADGRFTLAVPERGEGLAFAYDGYVRREIPIDDRTEFNIELSTHIDRREQYVDVE